MLRKLAERLSRGRNFRHRLPKRFGGCRMLVTPESGLGYWLPAYAMRRDENLLTHVAQWIKPGSVVWDVGANMGVVSFVAAGLAGPKVKVYALRARHYDGARLLRRSALLNPQAAPVEVIPCAVGASLSLSRFNIASHNRSTNFLEGFGTGLTQAAFAMKRRPCSPFHWIGRPNKFRRPTFSRST